MSSNISQNYPYCSETEVDRRANVAAALARFDGLKAKVAAETTPLDSPETSDVGAATRWWIWVCPKHDFTGRLHVAGFAIERHALYTVCDTCGEYLPALSQAHRQARTCGSRPAASSSPASSVTRGTTEATSRYSAGE